VRLLAAAVITEAKPRQYYQLQLALQEGASIQLSSMSVIGFFVIIDLQEVLFITSQCGEGRGIS
jgi:hypothetical protein